MFELRSARSQALNRGRVSARRKVGRLLRRLRSIIKEPQEKVWIRPVPFAAETTCTNPIFIASLHRSGSSLLRRVLDSHSQIACPPESYVLRHFVEMHNDPLTTIGLRGLGIQTTEVTQEVRAWASAYHDGYRSAVGKTRWADKTPQYVSILEDLRKLFGNDAQFIVLYRHPLDIVYSLYEGGWSPSAYDGVLTPTGDPLVDAARYVADRLPRLRRFQGANANACHVVRYEALATTPEEVLPALFEFLGLEWEATVLQFNSHRHNEGLEDPYVQGLSAFEPSIDNWKLLPDRSLHRVVPILGEEIANLGYSYDYRCSAE